MTITVLLILHGLGAFFLLGAITHQAIGAWKARPLPAGNFFQSVVNVRGGAYTNAVVVLYLLVSIGGGVIYPAYVLDVKGSLNDARMLSAIGAFEIKEHFAIIGVAMLPPYWYIWKKVASGEHLATRRLTTTLLALIVWWNFLIGHILNNIKGLL
jgi:hypothetical protein